MNTENRITVTDQDERRLFLLLQARESPLDSDRSALLEERLAEAVVVPARVIPRNVVTMNSVVVFEDIASGKRREITLVYPGATKISAGGVSIFAPVGTALLGLTEGETVSWPVPGKHQRGLRVVEVKYQPEASGRFDL